MERVSRKQEEEKKDKFFSCSPFAVSERLPYKEPMWLLPDYLQINAAATEEQFFCSGSVCCKLSQKISQALLDLKQLQMSDSELSMGWSLVSSISFSSTAKVRGRKIFPLKIRHLELL